MLKEIFLIGAVTIASNVLFAFSGVGSGAFGQGFECTSIANMKMNDYGYGVDPDGVALYFDNSGKTVIVNQDKIVNRKTENGEETITYKTKVPKYTGSYAKVEFETVNKTIVIKRGPDGKMISFSKLHDTKEQADKFKQMLKEFGGQVTSFNLIKSENYEFVNSGDDCYLNQNISVEMKSDSPKEEKSVYFDKKFCDSIAPIVNNMGKQNAAQCGNLIAAAQSSFKNRYTELLKEEKNLKLTSYFGQTKPETNNFNVFSLTGAIQSCLPLQAGFGMGGFAGGGGYYNPGAVGEKTESKKPSSKASQ